MDADREERDWRPVVAALAHPRRRRVYAQIVLGNESKAVGSDLSPRRRAQTLETLCDSGLIAETSDGHYVENADVFQDLLVAAAGPARPQGIQRFLTEGGKIDRYPSKVQERGELLKFIAQRVVDDNEAISESTLNERLNLFTDDAATLRRYMVDYKILTRESSGAEYSRRAGEL